MLLLYCCGRCADLFIVDQFTKDIEFIYEKKSREMYSFSGFYNDVDKSTDK